MTVGRVRCLFSARIDCFSVFPQTFQQKGCDCFLLQIIRAVQADMPGLCCILLVLYGDQHDPTAVPMALKKVGQICIIYYCFNQIDAGLWCDLPPFATISVQVVYLNSGNLTHISKVGKRCSHLPAAIGDQDVTAPETSADSNLLHIHHTHTLHHYYPLMGLNGQQTHKDYDVLPQSKHNK